MGKGCSRQEDEHMVRLWTALFIVPLQCNYFLNFIYWRLWLLIAMFLNKLYLYYVNEIFQILYFNFSDVENRGCLIYVFLLGIVELRPKDHSAQLKSEFQGHY